jgi:predicted DNA-binding transcriptional regulator AlpA
VEKGRIGFVQAEQAAKMFSVSKSTWFRWRRRGVISKGVRLGYNRTGWPLEEVRELFERIKSGEVKLR